LFEVDRCVNPEGNSGSSLLPLVPLLLATIAAASSFLNTIVF
jgi:hypothetical protein